MPARRLVQEAVGVREFRGCSGQSLSGDSHMSELGHSRPMDSAPVLNNVCFAPIATVGRQSAIGRYVPFREMFLLSHHAATLIVPSRLSTMTGEWRYSMTGGEPYLPSTNFFHSAVYIRSASAREAHT